MKCPTCKENRVDVTTNDDLKRGYKQYMCSCGAFDVPVESESPGLPRLEIKGAPNKTEVRLNGQLVPGLIALTLAMEAGEPSTVLLTIRAGEVEVDQETLVALETLVSKEDIEPEAVTV